MTQHIPFLEVGVGQHLLHDLVACGVALESQLQRLDGDRLTGIHRHDHIIAAQQPLLGIAERDLSIVVTEGLQRFLGTPDDLVLVTLGRDILLQRQPRQIIDHVGGSGTFQPFHRGIQRQCLWCQQQAGAQDQRLAPAQIAACSVVAQHLASRLERTRSPILVATHCTSLVRYSCEYCPSLLLTICHLPQAGSGRFVSFTST